MITVGEECALFTCLLLRIRSISSLSCLIPFQIDQDSIILQGREQTVEQILMSFISDLRSLCLSLGHNALTSAERKQISLDR